MNKLVAANKAHEDAVLKTQALGGYLKAMIIADTEAEKDACYRALAQNYKDYLLANKAMVENFREYEQLYLASTMQKEGKNV